MPVHFGLAIKNFVGPTETPDIDRRGVEAAVSDYLARYVHAPASFEDYLELFGGARLKRAQDAARELTGTL